MYTVYVLKDAKGKMYKGMTNDLPRRLKEHKLGHTRSTKHLQEPSVVYTEEHENRSEARKREKYLKSAAGRRFLEKYMGP